MKKTVFALLTLLLTMAVSAQESHSSYDFLRLPVSAHVAALGGDNITIADDDPTLVFHNPSLLSGVSDKSLNVNYMTYMEGTKTASASFVKALEERSTWAAFAQYVDYGTVKQVTADHVILGDFSAKDIVIGGSFAYVLAKNLTGGVSAKVISSSIADYSSMAVAVDLGLNYYDEERGLSVSAVARNLGGQVKAYEDDFEKIPFDLQLGVSKKLAGAPLRFSATLIRINDWNDGLKNHLVIGADLLLSQQIYLSGGYNFRRADEMTIKDSETESSHGAGLSFGGGIELSRLKFSVAYAKYHVTASSLLFNATYTL